MIGLQVRDEAIWAADAIGDDCVSRYCRDIASDAIEWTGNADIGESVNLVEIDEMDRVALTILSAIDYEKGSFVQGAEDWAKCEARPEDWADVIRCVVWIDSRGFAYPEFFTGADVALRVYEEMARTIPHDSECDCEECEVEEEEPQPGTDEYARKYPLREDVRQAELWGGVTE